MAPEGLASEVNDHFGMSEYFLLLDAEEGRIVSTEVLEDSPTIKERKTPAEIMADHGVKVVLAGGIGPHMIAELAGHGIRIFRGAAGTAGQAFEDYMAGMLSEVTS